MIILQIAIIVALPLALFKLESKVNWLKSIVMAYVLGILIGNVMPQFFEYDVLHELTGVSIILAIPLMLFSSNIKDWIKQPKKMLISYMLAVIATSISVAIGWIVFVGKMENMPLISGMIEGVYTGGTINLNAVGYAFDSPDHLRVLLNGYDMAFSGIYLLAIFTFLPKLLKKFLGKGDMETIVSTGVNEVEFSQLDDKKKLISIFQGIGLSGLILGLVAGISILLTKQMDELIIIFGVTGLALLSSNMKQVQRIKGTMVMADYFMIIFGFTLGAQANISELLTGHEQLLMYFLLIYTSILIIHLILVRLFNIDSDTFLVSSTAAIFGPPFIGPVAESLNKRNLIAPGIIVALMGNAIGTYLGILVVKLLI
jgi:uncharacterized membrane protein